MAYNYYNSYAFQYGFEIRKESIDKSRSAPNIVIFRTFVSKKAGKKRMTDRELGKVVRKPDKSELWSQKKIKLTSSDTWVVTKFVGEYTHDIISLDSVSPLFPQEATSHRGCKDLHPKIESRRNYS